MKFVPRVRQHRRTSAGSAAKIADPPGRMLAQPANTSASSDQRGELSDMVNLTRARDAAFGLAESEPTSALQAKNKSP